MRPSRFSTHVANDSQRKMILSGSLTYAVNDSTCAVRNYPHQELSES